MTENNPSREEFETVRGLLDGFARLMPGQWHVDAFGTLRFGAEFAGGRGEQDAAAEPSYAQILADTRALVREMQQGWTGDRIEVWSGGKRIYVGAINHPTRPETAL